jgi:hypothetical protein
MKIKVVSKYSNQKAQYGAGQVIDVPEEEAAFLMNDAPGCFDLVNDIPADTEQKEFTAPVDKMERKHRTK